VNDFYIVKFHELPIFVISNNLETRIQAYD
jgi:hypothetical protein